MRKSRSKVSKFLVGAAIAGLWVGSTAPLLSCSGDGGASAKERNGCNGPNGCGGTGNDKKEANGCNGPNGCGAAGHGKKEANGCNGPNGCKGAHEQKKN